MNQIFHFRVAGLLDDCWNHMQNLLLLHWAGLLVFYDLMYRNQKVRIDFRDPLLLLFYSEYRIHMMSLRIMNQLLIPDYSIISLTPELLFLRWKIEKVFDCFKNSFGEIKAWATGSKATQIQGNLICLVYNFVQFLSEKTKKHESCEDEKAEKKYAKNLELRERKAAALGRFIHPLIYTSRRISRISYQFIRSVRNHLFSKKPLSLVLPIFADRLRRYL